jgi:hypothetical protein
MDPEDYRAELIAKYTPKIGQYAHVKRHVERKEMQQALRVSIAWWGAYQREQGRPDSESYRRFYFMFGVDVLSAQTLNTRNAEQLATRINNYLGNELQQVA